MKAEINLPMKASDAVDYLQAKGHSVYLIGSGKVLIEGFSDPGCYRIGTALWLGDSKYLNLPDGLTRSDVAVLFCSDNFDALDDFPTIVVCDDPRNAFMALIEAVVQKETMIGIHSSSIIEDGAIIGRDVSIGPYAVVEAGAQIGDRTTIGAGSVIRGCVTIGSDCLVFPKCSLGSDGYGFRKLQDGTLRRLPHIGGLVIHDNVEIGAGSVVDRGTFRDTVIEEGTKIDSLTLIGHNVQIGKGCLIIGGLIGGNTVIGDYCEVIHATIKNRVHIGNGVRVGIGSVILRDVPDGVECFGNPARVISR